MHAADIGPVPPGERTQSAVDLFLIFVGANIVATTMQVGASLASSFSLRGILELIALGSVAGSALVGALAPLGPRLGVPSVIAARAALGIRGAGVVAFVLYLTNFAWIAVNNVIAASACARAAGGDDRAWAVALGLLATVVVACGPRAVGRADRAAVPLLAVTGALLTVACLRLPSDVFDAAPSAPMAWSRGLDVVIGYQVSWILMFADYSRYTRSESRSAAAVFLGLASTSLWFMPLGAVAARAAGSPDPGAMLERLGLGGWGAVLLAVATLTTNFVNIYLSSLAWKSLFPRSGEQASIWSIGLIGSALSLLSTAWLDRYVDLMLGLGTVLVPVGGVILAHYFVLPLLRGSPQGAARIAQLYDRGGPHARHFGFSLAGVGAWTAGAIAYHLAGASGGTLPSLAATIAVYGLSKRGGDL
jgi:purine-cytosine permease-like protein